MDLFQKIDLFEKLAMQLTGSESDSDLETFDNTNESEPKESIQARVSLLQSLLRK